MNACHILADTASIQTKFLAKTQFLSRPFKKVAVFVFKWRFPNKN